MTELGLLASQQLVQPYLQDNDVSLVVASCFACARSHILMSGSYYELILSLTGNLEVSKATVKDESHAARWQQLRKILMFYEVENFGIQGTLSSLADIVGIATSECESASTCKLKMRQLVFELAAHTEKEAGNKIVSSCDYVSALRHYTKGLRLLGFHSSRSSLTRLSAEARSSSPELTLGLFSNSSLCQLKIGSPRAAMDISHQGLEVLVSLSANIPEELQSMWVKLKHRFASSLVRLGRFAAALRVLDEVDKHLGKRSPATTATLRTTIKKLKALCSPVKSYTCLPAHLAAKKDEMLQAVRAAERSPGHSVRYAILTNFLECPLLLLLGMPEVQKALQKQQISSSSILRMIERSQDPMQPGLSMSQGSQNTMKLDSMIHRTYNAAQERRDRRRHRQELPQSLRDIGFPGMEEDSDGSDPEDEEVPQREILLMRWVLAYSALDAHQWNTARDTLETLIYHATVDPGAAMYYPDHMNRFTSPTRSDFRHALAGDKELNILSHPRHYMSQLTYLLALAEFGAGDASACGAAIEAYMDLVPQSLKDHNYSDALYMQAWAELKPMQGELEFETLRTRRLSILRQQVRDVDRSLDNAYKPPLDDLFEQFSWVRGRCYHDLGVRPLPGEYQQVFEQVESERNRMDAINKSMASSGVSEKGDPFGGKNPMDVFSDFDSMLGSIIGTTQRYRMSLQEKAKSRRRGQSRGYSGGFGFPGIDDMEQDMYDMQQNMMASVLGGSFGGGGFGGLDNMFGGYNGEDDEDEDDEEEED